MSTTRYLTLHADHSPCHKGQSLAAKRTLAVQGACLITMRLLPWCLGKLRKVSVT